MSRITKLLLAVSMVAATLQVAAPGAVLAQPAAAPAAAQAVATPTTGAALTQQFAEYGNTSGAWSGADSTVSVRLPDGRTAWLFSDSMIGPVNADFSRPKSTPMINNSMVVQSGTTLTTRHGGTSGAPESLFKATQAGEFYWIADGTVDGSTMKVVLNRYKKTGEGALDVQLTGTALATVALPGLTVTSIVDLPYGAATAWGNALLETASYTYIYGSEYVAADEMRFARLARVPAGGLGGAWQFWTGAGWSSTAADSARLPLSGVGTAFAAQKVGSQYVITTVESNTIFSPQVVAYTSNNPHGPFTGPIDLFTAPEPASREGVIVYDARLHPEQAETGKLLVSYNVHSLVPGDLYADARIYRPRFVDVAWPRPTPDPSAVPGAPTGLTATQQGESGEIKLTWPASSGTVTGYHVYQRDVTAGQTHFARVAQPTTTTANLGRFKTGHTYEFKVAGHNTAGEGQPSPTRSVDVTIAPPPAPSGLTADANSNGTVTLSWSTVPYAWSYSVYRRDVTTREADFSPVFDNDSRDTTVNASWLTHGHEYEFVVTAMHGGGESVHSNPARATASYTRPSAPTNVTATAQSNGNIKVAWSGPDDVYYFVYQRDVTAGEPDFTKLPLPITCCELSAGYLAHGHTYEYKVVATNQGGDSPASSVVSATSKYPPTAAPSNLRADAGNGEVKLTWDTSATDGAWYWVYQRNVTEGETEFTRLPLPISTCCTMTAGYLRNDHVYEFKVTATMSGGESTATNVVRATPQLPLPGAVAGLTATPQSDGDIKLSWTAPGPDVYYWIYQRDATAGEAWKKLPFPTDRCCSFTAGLLKHGHRYEFKVAAENNTGMGPVSNVASAVCSYAKPPAPTGLVATAVGGGSIDLDWNSAGSGLYYWIYWRDATAGDAFARTPYPTDKTFHSFGSLVHGHRYEFKVSAENQGGEGATSAVANAVSTGGLPQPPSGLSASPGNGKATLSWTASPSSGVYYWIEYRPVGGNWTRLQYPLSTCCSFTVEYLANGTTYEFRLRATNASGDSAASYIATARPLPPLPSRPPWLSASAGDGRATLSWGASPSPDVYYWIEYQPAGASTWQRLKYPVSTCCTFTVTYLTNGTTYNFRVRSTNLAGDSSASPIASARPMPPLPTAPGNLTASAHGDTAVTLNWNSSTPSSVYYWIYYRQAGAANWTKAEYPVVNCCTFTMRYLIPGRTYEFHLRAENLSGFSPQSSTRSVYLQVTPPGRPTNIKVVPRLDGPDVDVSWATVANATGYTIQSKPCRGGSWSSGHMVGDQTSVRMFGYGCNHWRVIANRWGWDGPASTENAYAFGTHDDYGWHNGWFDRYGFITEQCTSFAAWRVYKYVAKDPPGFTALNYWHAYHWDTEAAIYGWVSQTPAVGAIAQWEHDPYGHVAWVAGIDGDYLIIEEYNYLHEDAYSRRRIHKSDPDHFLSVVK